MADWFVGCGLLGGAFILGFLVCNFIKEGRETVMAYLYGKAMEEHPCRKRLEDVQAVWQKMRSLFFAYRSGLLPQQYFLLSSLIDEMDARLGYNESRDTPAEENED